MQFYFKPFRHTSEIKSGYYPNMVEYGPLYTAGKGAVFLYVNSSSVYEPTHIIDIDDSYIQEHILTDRELFDILNCVLPEVILAYYPKLKASAVEKMVAEIYAYVGFMSSSRGGICDRARFLPFVMSLLDHTFDTAHEYYYKYDETGRLIKNYITDNGLFVGVGDVPFAFGKVFAYADELICKYYCYGHVTIISLNHLTKIVIYYVV